MTPTDLSGLKVGIALTGSFCNLHMAFSVIEELSDRGASVQAILSYNVDRMDTRFHRASDVKEILRALTGKNLIKELTEAEPVGPRDMFDVLLILPATGNTVAKLANAISDTPVLMATKSHLRNKKPVVIALSTNDGLGNNGANIGRLMNMENVFFVPFAQDDCINKEMSLVFKQDQVIDTLLAALDKKQLQPVVTTW